MALAMSAPDLLSTLCSALGRASRAGGWRSLEATLHAVHCVAPALLPPAPRLRLGAEVPPESTEQAELAPMFDGILRGVVALPPDAHSALMRSALRVVGALAPWLSHPARADELTLAAGFALRALSDDVALVLEDAAAAFSTLCCQQGCAVRLASAELLPSLLAAVMAALGTPRLAGAPHASQLLLSGLMRLVVSLPAADLPLALQAVSAPLVETLSKLVARLAAEAGAPCAEHTAAACVDAVQLISCTLRYLDSTPLLADGHAALRVLHASWPALEAARAHAAHDRLQCTLCELYVAAMSAGGVTIAPALHQLIEAMLALLRAAGRRDASCAALQALAKAVEVFGHITTNVADFAQLLADASGALGGPQAVAEAPQVTAAFLDLLFRACLFCSPALFGSPQVLHGALQLLVHSIRQQSRDLLRSACSLLARLSSGSAAELAPHLASLAEPLLASLLAAIATHAPSELMPRVADALRTLLQCCHANARGWLGSVVNSQGCGALAPEAKQQFVQAALELLDDSKSFRAMVCDLSLLCRAPTLLPREAMQTSIFIL